MEFDELLITTGVDALVKLVKQKGKIELEEASNTLNIAPDTLEDWARVLEEEGIIKVQYKLTKIYLLWVQPTVREVEEEKRSFEEEKKGLMEEIEKTKAELAPEFKKVEELHESFTGVYDKLYKRLDELEKTLSPVISTKEVSEKRFDESLKKVSDVLSEISKVKTDITDLRKEIQQAEKTVSKTKTETSFAKVKKTEDEIFSLMSELRELKRKMKQETPEDVKMPSAYDMKKKLDSLSKDFTEIKRRNSNMREDVINLKEGSQIVSMVGGSIKDYEKNATTLKKELSQLTKDADNLFEKVKAVDEKLKENLDTMERFSDSLDVAKGIVTRFPSQKKLEEEIDLLMKKEHEIEDKMGALKKLLRIVGGKRVSAREAENLAQKVEEKLEELKEESLRISESLEEDKNRYLTFQQIKERIVPSISKYQNEIQRLEKELDDVKKVTYSQQDEVKKEAEKFADKIGKGEAQQVVKIAKEVKDKKKLLDEINESISNLSEISESLNRRLVLLSRQAKLLEIRAGAPEEKAEMEAKEKLIKDQMKLTKAEEKEFLRKRQELKKLIKKLWEEG